MKHRPATDAQDLANFRAVVMDGAISAIIATDLNGRILDWNKSAERIFLLTRDQAVGQNLADVLLGASSTNEPLIRVAMNPDTYSDDRYVREWELLTATGHELHVEIGVRRFESGDGHRLVTFIRDVGDRVEAQKARASTLGRLMHAESEERSHIAEELHDDTIQVMAATLMKLDTCELRVAELSQYCQHVDGASEVLEDYRLMLTGAIFTLREALKRTRRMMFELRPPALKASGLALAVRTLVKEVERETHTTSKVSIDVGRYPQVVEDLAYRVILESLTNIRKHAHACNISIDIHERDDAVYGTIKDDGQGFDAKHTLAQDRHLHLGLDSCSERVKLAGGRYFVASEPGAGTTVSFDIPVMNEITWETLHEMVG